MNSVHRIGRGDDQEVIESLRKDKTQVFSRDKKHQKSRALRAVGWAHHTGVRGRDECRQIVSIYSVVSSASPQLFFKVIQSLRNDVVRAEATYKDKERQLRVRAVAYPPTPPTPPTHHCTLV